MAFIDVNEIKSAKNVVPETVGWVILEILHREVRIYWKHFPKHGKCFFGILLYSQYCKMERKWLI